MFFAAVVAVAIAAAVAVVVRKTTKSVEQSPSLPSCISGFQQLLTFYLLNVTF